MSTPNGTDRAPQTPPASVLVIDDDPDVRALVCLALEQAGFEVRCAADGAAGLACQRGRPADVVLCDIFMPGQDGLVTIRELHRESPGVKVVAVSGGGVRFPESDFLTMAKRFGAAAALHKPLTPAVLVEAVRAVLGQ